MNAPGHLVSQRAEISVLTWLRGLAALLVIVSHTVRATESGYGTNGEGASFLLFDVLDLGALGVTLFFVLSGCTLYISNTSLQAASLRGVAGFYLKRFMRIWPAFFVAMCAYLVFRPIFQEFYGAPLGNWIEQQFLAESTITDIIKYLLLIFNITGPDGLYNNAFWSLPVEFQYYLLFPVLLLSMRWSAHIAPVVITGGLYLLAKTGVVHINSTIVLTLAFTFAAGMMIGHVYLHHSIRIPQKLAMPLIAVVIAMASLMANGVVPIEAYRVIPGEYEFYGICGIALVTFTLFGECALPRLIEPALMYLGHISYSLYLYHNLLIAIAAILLISLNVHAGWTWLATVALFAFPGTVLIATISYRWVELPGIRFGRTLYRLIGLGR